MYMTEHEFRRRIEAAIYAVRPDMIVREYQAAVDEQVANAKAAGYFDVCPITGKAECADRECELHYMDAPLNPAPVGWDVIDGGPEAV